MNSLENVIQTLNENDSFLITSHLSPDGDAIGSAIALGLALKKLNKEVSYYMDPSIGEKMIFLAEVENFSKSKLKEHYDVGILLDCSDKNHLYDSKILSKCKITLNIDHHISNKIFGDVNLVDSDAGATGEMIFSIITSLNVDLDKDMAEALYTAVVTDTGSFKYSNVTSRTHYITSELLKYPIYPWKISKRLFDEHLKSKIFLVGRAISNLQLRLKEKLAIMVITQKDLEDTKASQKEVEGIINIGRDIQGVEVAVLLKEKEKNQFKVSFRSNEYVDVGEIALTFGGGGHSKASGCVMQGSKEQIIQQLESIISKKL